MAKSIPKEQRAILAAHEGGAHDGPPYGKPRPDICPSCRDDKSGATEVMKIVTRKMAQALAEPQPTLAAPADLDPKPPRRRKATPVSGALDLPPSTGDAELSAVAEVPAGGMAEKATGTFLTEVIGPAPLLTREGWMIQAVEVMRRWFPEDHPVPEVRVSIGWPAGRGSSRFIGQCFYTTADHAPALFVAPSLSDVGDILETLLHEAVHAAAGSGHGPQGPLRQAGQGPRVRRAVARDAGQPGTEGPFTRSRRQPRRVPPRAGRQVRQHPALRAGYADAEGGVPRVRVHPPDDEPLDRDRAGLPTCGCGEQMEQTA